MSRIYSAVRFRLDNVDRYLIYYDKDISPEAPDDEPVVDGVVLDSNGKMPVFRNIESLMAYAQAHDLAPIDTDYINFCDLDRVIAWMRRKRHAKLDCDLFLTTWNLLEDISVTIDGDFDLDLDRTDRIYDKLFGGSSTGPILMEEGARYMPIWPGRESRIIREVIGEGLQMFRSIAKLYS